MGNSGNILHYIIQDFLGGGGGCPIQDTLRVQGSSERTLALSNPVHTAKRTMPLSIMIFINIVTRTYRTKFNDFTNYVITVAYSNF